MGQYLPKILFPILHHQNSDEILDIYLQNHPGTQNACIVARKVLKLDMSTFSQVGSKIKGKLLDTVTTGSLFGSKRRISDRKEKVVYGF